MIFRHESLKSLAAFTSKLKSYFLVQAHLTSLNACVWFFASFRVFFSYILVLFFFSLFSLSVLHLHVHPYLFLSYLMNFYVLKKLYDCA